MLDTELLQFGFVLLELRYDGSAIHLCNYSIGLEDKIPFVVQNKVFEPERRAAESAEFAGSRNARKFDRRQMPSPPPADPTLG
jgi:hypothetical protein